MYFTALAFCYTFHECSIDVVTEQCILPKYRSANMRYVYAVPAFYCAIVTNIINIIAPIGRLRLPNIHTHRCVLFWLPSIDYGQNQFHIQMYTLLRVRFVRSMYARPCMCRPCPPHKSTHTHKCLLYLISSGCTDFSVGSVGLAGINLGGKTKIRRIGVGWGAEAWFAHKIMRIDGFRLTLIKISNEWAEFGICVRHEWKKKIAPIARNDKNEKQRT